MRVLLIPCVAFCSLAVSGCSAVYSANLLNTSQDAVEEPALAGRWVSSDNDDDLCIFKADGNTYTMTVSDKELQTGADVTSPTDAQSPKSQKLVETFQITLVRLNDQLFADMIASGQLLDNKEIEPQVGAMRHHLLLKLELTDSDLAYSALDKDAIREAGKQGYAPLSYVEIHDDVLLTASTDDLRWSLSHYADRLFGEVGHYTRATDNNPDGSTTSPCNAISSSTQ